MRFQGYARDWAFGALLCFRSAPAVAWFRVPPDVGIDLGLAQAREVIGDRIFRIQAKVLGVGADESFVEYAAGQLIEVLFFDGLQHARTDLRDVRHVIERELFFLARLAKFVSELSHW